MMMRTALYVTAWSSVAAAFLRVVLLATAVAGDPLAPTCAKPVRVDLLHDGDTITRGSIDLGWGRRLSIGPGQEAAGIRAFGYDAWEITKTRRTVDVTPEEIAKGIAARDDLAALLKTGWLYAEDSGGRDPYGRLSAVLWVKQGGQWIYLAKWMDDRGHLRASRATGKKK
jgi:endonuclease YncB( thermonuclease family)